MEPILLILGLMILGYLLVAPAVALANAGSARRTVVALESRVELLRLELADLAQKLTAPRPLADGKDGSGAERFAPPAVQTARAYDEPIRPPAPRAEPPELPTLQPTPPLLPRTAPHTAPPPSPVAPASTPGVARPLPPPSLVKDDQTSSPPAIPSPVPKGPKSHVETTPSVSLEQFLGVKLFAWIGGLALFLGIVFFVKYAFERNLIPPAVRTAAGFLVGAGLIGTGVTMRKQKAYLVLSQTLTATGFLILYGVTYAAHELYHFPIFGAVTTFIVMSLITAGAFALAVGMNAQVIAVLGMAGGFLTPVLVNSGHDNPFGLFSYVALLDLGLILVTHRRGWSYLTLCAAAGTSLMELAWHARYFESGHYDHGMLTAVPMAVYLFFPALFTLSGAWLKRAGQTSLFPGAAALANAGWSLIVAFAFLNHSGIAGRPLALYTFLLGLNGLVLWQIYLQPRLWAAQWVAVAGTFLHLSLWSADNLSESNLWSGLACYLAFAGVHAGFGLIPPRREYATTAKAAPQAWMGPIASLLILFPVVSLEHFSWTVWPVLLMLNAMTLLIAAKNRQPGPVYAALGSTLLAMGLWLGTATITSASLSGLLAIVLGMTIPFVLSGLYLGERGLGPNIRPLAIAAATLPFGLVVLAAVRVKPADPTPIFAATALLVGQLLWMVTKRKLPLLSLGALLGSALVEYAWLATAPNVYRPVGALLWLAGIAALLALPPLIWPRRHEVEGDSTSWKVSALAWALAFPLVYWVVKRNFHLEWMGLVPAAFVAPPLLSLAVCQRRKASPELRLCQQAWFGGVALFFITVICPLQFHRQWLTVSWALEGAALCWLATRVPHPGLRRVGAALLAVTFVRLALNPSVLTYRLRSDNSILNGFLYTYGIVAIAHLMAARWLRSSEDRPAAIPLRCVMPVFAGILLFVLLNLEIANAFTPPGQAFLALDFTDNFARGMTYSIAWAAYSLALIVIGFRWHLAGARYAGIGLMSLTLLKVFLYDLANIGSIYRIGALMAVAILALGASFLYQRYYSRGAQARGTCIPSPKSTASDR